MATTPLILKSMPGIKRDGTQFDGEFYTDGQWVRFQRGLPRKIAGYRAVSKLITQVSRGFTGYTNQDNVYCHTGSVDYLQRFTLDLSGNASIVSNRTPAGYTINSANMWMFDTIYSSVTGTTLLTAHVAPNGQTISNDVGGAIYSGNVLTTAALTNITIPAGANATGGIVALHPYLFYYGSGGIVGWSVAGSPTDLSGAGSGTARVWGQKIIKGLPLRAGAGNAPAGIFWAYDAVIRASFVGGATVFQFDTIATDTSILSSNCVVDYDGVFYWAGVDRFLSFNGVVREVPNQFNVNWFFDGLNDTQKQKVFAFKMPRFGEIWWAYPRGSATECTHAVIYNIRENCWYDTELPNSGRSAGVFSNAFAAPILTGIEPTSTGYTTWLHEQGVDEVDGITTNPVESYFQTSDISSVAKGTDAELRVESIEPDFVQVGNLEVVVSGKMNARAPEVVGTPVIFPATASQVYEQVVVMKEQRRELRVKFSSNVLGGDYQMGQIIAHIGQGDKTRIA